LAIKEGLAFFEISAKTSNNVENMFYSCITELPFFDQFQNQNKQKLIEELSKYFFSNIEMYNKAEVVDNSILDIVNAGKSNNLQVKGAKNGKKKTSERCKC
jgi:hypothetical protein